MKQISKILLFILVLGGVSLVTACNKATTKKPGSVTKSQTATTVTPTSGAHTTQAPNTTEKYNSTENTTTTTQVVHTHDAVEVPAVEARVGKAGHLAYYSCECGKYFEDQNCERDISDLEAWLNGNGKVELSQKEQNDLINQEAEFINRYSEKDGNVWDGWDTSVTKVTDKYSPIDSEKAALITIAPLKDSEGAWLDERHEANKAVWSTVDFKLSNVTNVLDFACLDFDFLLDNAQNWISIRFVDAQGNLSGEYGFDLTAANTTPISVDGWKHVSYDFSTKYNFATLKDDSVDLSAEEEKLYNILTNAVAIRLCFSDSKADLTKASKIYVDNLELRNSTKDVSEYAEAAAQEIKEKHLDAKLLTSGAFEGYTAIPYASLNDDTAIKFVFKMNDGVFGFVLMASNWANYSGDLKITKSGDEYTFNKEGISVYPDRIEGWMVCEVKATSFTGDGISAEGSIAALFEKNSTAEVYVDYDSFELVYSYDALDHGTFVNRYDETAENVWDGWDTTVDKETTTVSPISSSKSTKVTIAPLKDSEGAWLDERHEANKAVWSTVDFQLAGVTDILEFSCLDFDFLLDNAQNWISIRFVDAQGNLSGEYGFDFSPSNTSAISADGWKHVSYDFSTKYNFATLKDDSIDLSAEEEKLYNILTNAVAIRLCFSDSKADLTKASKIYVDNLELRNSAKDVSKYVEAAAEEIKDKHLDAKLLTKGAFEGYTAIPYASLAEGQSVKFAFKMTDGVFGFVLMASNWANYSGDLKITKSGDEYTFNKEGISVYPDKLEGWMICEVKVSAFNGDGINAEGSIAALFEKNSTAEVYVDYTSFEAVAKPSKHVNVSDIKKDDFIEIGKSLSYVDPAHNAIQFEFKQVGDGKFQFILMQNWKNISENYCITLNGSTISVNKSGVTVVAGDEKDWYVVTIPFSTFSGGDLNAEGVTAIDHIYDRWDTTSTCQIDLDSFKLVNLE